MSEQKYKELVERETIQDGDMYRTAEAGYKPCYAFVGDPYIKKSWVYGVFRPITEPDYSDPAYQQSINDGREQGLRIEQKNVSSWGVRAGRDAWESLTGCIVWANGWVYRIHPDDLPKLITEPDYTSKEYQDAFRLAWAADPAIERDDMPRNGTRGWQPNVTTQSWSGELYFYRPRQQPKIKSQFEIDDLAMREHFEKNGDVLLLFKDGWHSALAWERSRQPNNAA